MEKEGEAARPSVASPAGEFTSPLDNQLSEEIMELENIPSVVPVKDEQQRMGNVERKIQDAEVSDKSEITFHQAQNHPKSKSKKFIKKSFSVPFSEDDSDDEDEQEDKVLPRPRRCVSAYPEPSLSEKVRRLLSPKAKSNRIMDSGIGEEGNQENTEVQVVDNQSESETEDEDESQHEIRGDVIIPISNDDTGEIEDLNSDLQTPAAASRFRAIANAQAACNAMMEQARENIFLESMQCLYGVLLVGYFCCLVPFKVVYKNGKYGIQNSWIRMIIITTLVLASLVFQFAYANYKIGEVHNVKKYPEEAFYAAQQVTCGLLIMAFLYAFTMKKDKLDEMFSTFSNILPAVNKFQKPAFIRSICAVTILLIILSLWMSLGKLFISLGDFNEWENTLLYQSQDYFGIAEIQNKLLSHLVAFVMTTLAFYNELMKYYIDLVMMSCAVTLYLMEKKARKYCFQEDHFDVEKTTGIFRQIKLLVHKINLAFGVMTVAFYIDVVLFGVYTITALLEARHFEWERTIICSIKIAVIFLAAEGCANADNLVEQIITYKIRYVKTHGNDLSANVQHMNQVTEFRDVSRRAICLTGMDFFDVNHPLLGTVGLAVLTYILLIFEWKLDCGKCPETP